MGVTEKISGAVEPGNVEGGRRQKIAEHLEELQPKVIKSFRKAVTNGFPRLCPLCGYEGQFAPAGIPPRMDSQCPSCDSRERHRLFKIWLDRSQRITSEHKVLHFAPEPFFAQFLGGLAGEYVAADLRPRRVDLALNIEAMTLPPESFDVIIAHQILEHVDHHEALAECFRCLRSGGILVVTTPGIEAWAKSYENPEITFRAARFLHFGQDDHIKYFGRDIRDHIAAAGFDAEEFVSEEPDVSRHGLIRGETLYILLKPARAPVKPARGTPRTKKG